MGLHQEPSALWPCSSFTCWPAVHCSWTYYFPLLLFQKPYAHTTQQAHGHGDGLSHVLLLTRPHFTLTHFKIAWLLMSLKIVLSHKYLDMLSALFKGRKGESLLLMCTQEGVVTTGRCSWRISGFICKQWPHPP